MKKKGQPVGLNLDHRNLAQVRGKWTQKNGSVDEVNIINLLAFLKPKERIHFVNELWRVMKKGARATLNTPHWCSARSYGDLSFEWPPVAETWLNHLNKEWREKEAPWGKGYRCDFDVSGGYGLHPQIAARNTEYQMHAVSFWKEAAQDLIATLSKR